MSVELTAAAASVGAVVDTEKFDTVTLQTYTDAQIAFIASVEADYGQGAIGDLAADYREELAALVDEQ